MASACSACDRTYSPRSFHAEASSRTPAPQVTREQRHVVVGVVAHVVGEAEALAIALAREVEAVRSRCPDESNRITASPAARRTIPAVHALSLEQTLIDGVALQRSTIS